MPQELKEKALRITEALYRTTDLFSDAEPLKWSLRKASLDILSALSQLQDAAGLESLVKDILLKLELAASGTFMSKTNFDVLKREYLRFLGDAMSVRNSYQNLLDKITGNAISDSGLMDSKPVLAKPSLQPVGDARHKGGEDRGGLLISALKQNGPLGVGGLTKVLGESGMSVSQKTVQRELGSLVALGAVKQEGDKRWRRYYV